MNSQALETIISAFILEAQSGLRALLSKVVQI